MHLELSNANADELLVVVRYCQSCGDLISGRVHVLRLKLAVSAALKPACCFIILRLEYVTRQRHALALQHILVELVSAR